MRVVCEKEIEGLVSKGAAICIPFSEDGFVTSVFVIPKGSGGFKSVINLKKLNIYIKYEKFKMKVLESLRFGMRRVDLSEDVLFEQTL